MGYDDRREIFERLEALERLASSRGDERGSRGDDRNGGRRERDHHERRRGRDDGWEHRGRDGNGDFDEKRVVDTIVRLVCENVGEILAEQHEHTHAHHQDDGDREKHIIDQIVGCVSEHVREIVAEELDRRLGRPRLTGDEPEAPPTPRGGAPESEPD
jgi:hypothetical protein